MPAAYDRGQMSTHDEVRRQLTDAISSALADVERVASPEERYRSASWLVDELADGITAAGRFRGRAAVALRDEENLSLAQLGERLGLSKARAADIVRDTRRMAGRPPADAQLAVVAVVVTAPEGVLAIRRSDGKPPWTFPGGEIEPDETPAAAGRREVKEETGLEVVAGRVLGKRIHPQTGRQVIYLAARLARHIEARSTFAGDAAEVAEVRWLSRAEVDDLMPGAYGPVLAYLDRDHRRHSG
jgi:8-oxo-dGTP pyrophosphatase MutT (NUDIX family)